MIHNLNMTDIEYASLAAQSYNPKIGEPQKTANQNLSISR